MPDAHQVSDICYIDPIKLVKKYNLPNYLRARIPVKSKMNIQACKSLLNNYWDKQLLECLEFRFPLGFNSLCSLKHDKSDLKFPHYESKFAQKSYGAIIGPFQDASIENLHCSPFMTRHKPN